RMEKAWRWSRRNPTLATSLGVAAAALVAAAAISLLYGVSRSRANDRISQLNAGLEAEVARSHRNVASLALERGLASCREGEIHQGLLWLAESLRAADRAGDDGLRHGAATNLESWRRDACRLDAVLEHPGNVSAAVFSPDGTRLATACGDGTVRLFDVNIG